MFAREARGDFQALEQIRRQGDHGSFRRCNSSSAEVRASVFVRVSNSTESIAVPEGIAALHFAGQPPAFFRCLAQAEL
jgi:hypothetical protein